MQEFYEKVNKRVNTKILITQNMEKIPQDKADLK